MLGILRLVLRAPEGLVGLGPRVGPGQADVAQHVIAELVQLAALARPLELGQRDLGYAARAMTQPTYGEPGERRKGGRGGQRARAHCMGTILPVHHLHP